MTNVSGPTSTLPGSSRAAPVGMMCDYHQDRPAVRRVQGETDSFGAEYLDLCQECLDEIKKAEAESRIGRCDWCGKEATDLRPRRDIDEGMAGRVYDVCGECVRKENEQFRAELDERDYYDCDYDD